MNILRATGPPVFMYYLYGAGLARRGSYVETGRQFAEDARGCCPSSQVSDASFGQPAAISHSSLR